MTFVLGFSAIDRTQIALVGGKGASLGELSRIEGIRVPPGFCVTTLAFAGTGSGAMPADVAGAITDALAALGPTAAYAVRSSATAEDSPTASFAGQHDTYLNVVGAAAILEHIRRCWASLFTERAVAYRRHHALDPRAVQMAVVVQQMVAPEASGILFTADPVSGHRRVTAIEATPGLGDALVAGQVPADRYTVRDGALVTRHLAHSQPALTDAQALQLAQLGRRIAAHFGSPQDIEWCLADGEFHFVQSRPITTLFPIPVAPDDAPHVYISVGHQQMMTDAMKPLGLSLFQLTALRPMADAGGRLFVDVAPVLASPAGRASVLDMLGRSDPLIGDALQTLLDRGDVLPPLRDVAPRAVSQPEPIAPDPALVAALIARTQASVATLRREIQTRSGPALFDFILADLQELKRLLAEPQSHRVVMAGIEATWWLSDHLEAWLGERHAADPLAQSAPNNVTSEMGLALLEVADVIRPHGGVIAFLEEIAAAADDHHPHFLDELAALPGGPAARAAIAAYLHTYGMRCAGEIDITRPRWSECPTTLVPTVLGHVRTFRPGERARRFAHGLQAAATQETELLARVRALPDGEARAAETRRMIERVRTFIGFREYPKYGMICRYFHYKQALLAEAARLVDAGVLSTAEDCYFLTFQELHEAVRTHRLDARLVGARKETFRAQAALAPPRVLTSDGECFTGSYRRTAVPPGALVGLPVSAGTVEGRARVVLDMAQAALEPGDILVTTFTDPSWTPLFVTIAGLVTEVGGLMTHGAVIAREYGLPAVVGVEHATRLIRDGARIRVHGTAGYIEPLS